MANQDAPGGAALSDLGLISVSGADARAFLNAQLTNDILHLPAHQARRAGWCSAKGRLLAALLVVPQGEQLLLQLAGDRVAPVLKRLQMFVLRSKVKLADASGEWLPFGLWGGELADRCAALGVALPESDLGVSAAEGLLAIRVGDDRCLLLVRPEAASQVAQSLPPGEADDWTLRDIRDGLPRVVEATQDLFVPQMVNFERISALDFHKGCYPGQEVVARTQYRGQLKRRMVRLRAPVALRPAQDLISDDSAGQSIGSVVCAARGEALAVVQIAALEAAVPLRLEPGGPALEVLPLPYAA